MEGFSQNTERNVERSTPLESQQPALCSYGGTEASDRAADWGTQKKSTNGTAVLQNWAKMQRLIHKSAGKHLSRCTFHLLECIVFL